MAESFEKKLLRFLGVYLMPHAVNVLCKTLRIEVFNQGAIEKLKEKKQNFVVAFWHGKMAVGWYQHRDNNFAALVSQSKDGAILTNVLKKWGFQVSRGSSHKGGKESLEKILEFAGNNFSIAITPDGPTGPALKMKAGAVITAKKAQIPLVLMGIYIEKKRVLRSWDKFELPKFFSKVKIVYSNKIYIDNELTYEETSKKIEQCELKLNQLEKEAQRFAQGN